MVTSAMAAGVATVAVRGGWKRMVSSREDGAITVPSLSCCGYHKNDSICCNANVGIGRVDFVSVASVRAMQLSLHGHVFFSTYPFCLTNAPVRLICCSATTTHSSSTTINMLSTSSNPPLCDSY